MAYSDSNCTIQIKSEDLKQMFLDGAIVYRGDDEFAIPVFYWQNNNNQTGYVGFIGYLIPLSDNPDYARIRFLKGSPATVAEKQDLPDVDSTDSGKVLQVDDNGKWNASNLQSELPSVSSSDNGKVLGVVDGDWAVMSLPSQSS